MRHGTTSGGFNIFSTNGVLPLAGRSVPSGPPAMAQGRGDHARMLAHAAKRRLAAQNPSDRGSPSDRDPSDDRAYWKACAPVALNRAIAIRRECGLAKLP